MARADEYTYRVFFSGEDEAYVATVAEFPSLSCVEDSQVEAISGLVSLVEDVVEDMLRSGETPPMPFGTRTYSGRFALRMAPEQHRRIAMEAAEARVSINQLLVSRI